MMALSEQDKEWVQLTSEKLTYAVIEKVMTKHIEECPFGQKQLNYKHLLIGIVIGVLVVSGGGGLSLLLKFLGVPI